MESTSSNSAKAMPVKMTMDDAIERMGMGKFQNRLLLSAGLCIAADTMEILLLSFLTIVVQAEWDLKPEEASLITSMVFIGAILGTLILGPLGDHWGRKPLFIASTSFIALCGILTALSNTYWLMLISQFGVGFGIGGVVIPFDALAELISVEERGSKLLLLGYFWSIGTIAVPALAYVGLQEEKSWRIFVILCAIPCICSTLLAVAWVPESPRWLVGKGKSEEALNILRNAAETNGLDPMKAFPQGTQLLLEDHSKEIHSIGTLFRPEWRRMTFLLCSLWLGLAFLYWGTIQLVTLVFVDTDSKNLPEGVNFDFDYGAIISSSVAEAVGQTLVLCLIHRHGRIQITSTMYLLGGISIFCLCMAAANPDTDRSILVLLGFTSRGLGMGASSMTWIVTAELLPTAIRTTGHSAANAVARLGGAFSPFLVSPAVKMETIAIVMGIISILTSLAAWNLPETAGKSLGTQGRANLGSDGKPVQVSEIV